jgi:hypothetical protein
VRYIELPDKDQLKFLWPAVTLASPQIIGVRCTDNKTATALYRRLTKYKAFRDKRLFAQVVENTVEVWTLSKQIADYPELYPSAKADCVVSFRFSNQVPWSTAGTFTLDNAQQEYDLLLKKYPGRPVRILRDGYVIKQFSGYGDG